MSAQPEIGAWYRLRGGESFEVVAIDDADGTIDLRFAYMVPVLVGAFGAILLASGLASRGRGGG